jgi:hypothetical protein
VASSIGYVLGVFLASAGIGYLWLGLLWAVRVRKRWPRQSHWSAVAVTALIGVLAAASEQHSALALLGAAAAVGYMVWRGRPARLTPAAEIRK